MVRLIGALTLLALTLSGCALDYRLRYTGANRYLSRPHDYPITITEADIHEPYEIIGTVKTRAFEPWEAERRAARAMADAARRVGGDAVIEIGHEPYLGEQAGFDTLKTPRVGTTLTPMTRYYGTIIRYRRDLMTP